MVKNYAELSHIYTFEERFRYLTLNGEVGRATFGFDRWINQEFYKSREWKNVRDYVIVRDNGCDLGIEGYEIHSQLLVHHMNPITPDHIIHRDEDIVNPDFLITTTNRTHNAIHYGDESFLLPRIVDRRQGDTRLW